MAGSSAPRNPTLTTTQNGHTQRQFVVGGEVLGRYGETIDPKNPRTGDGNPNYTTVADFNFGYQAVSPWIKGVVVD